MEVAQKGMLHYITEHLCKFWMSGRINLHKRRYVSIVGDGLYPVLMGESISSFVLKNARFGIKNTKENDK